MATAIPSVAGVSSQQAVVLEDSFLLSDLQPGDVVAVDEPLQLQCERGRFVLESEVNRYMTLDRARSSVEAIAPDTCGEGSALALHPGTRYRIDEIIRGDEGSSVEIRATSIQLQPVSRIKITHRMRYIKRAVTLGTLRRGYDWSFWFERDPR